MRPKVIVHNSVSVDGAATGFEIDLGLHYHVAAQFGAQGSLVGSRTVVTGIETFGDPSLPEQPDDLRPPATSPDDSRPWWIVPDSTGSLLGLLHHMRSSGFCKDVVVLTTKRTPAPYLDYLRERQYQFHSIGDFRVDLHAALELIANRLGVKTVLTDSGGSLIGALLGQRLVDEVSLLVVPHIAGAGEPKLFRDVASPIPLKLVRQQAQDGGCLHQLYEVVSVPTE